VVVMARGPLRFRQRDVSATLRALKAAGVSVARVEVGKEGVTIVPGEPAAGASLDEADEVARIDRMIRAGRERRRKGG
jgi:hypothetical protein